ncbi:hypothetical protein SAMN04488048_10272 [Trichococcus flocculiformis]|nr:hypothetical protein SAMN04488048_10272 [Trichococcus flocculiformis]
MHYPAISKAKQ